MYGTHESSQCVEIIGADDLSREVEFSIAVECTARGCPAVMYMRNGDPGYPAEAPEFETSTIQIFDSDGKPHDITEAMFIIMMGDELAQKMLEDARTDAAENGDFS